MRLNHEFDVFTTSEVSGSLQMTWLNLLIVALADS